MPWKWPFVIYIHTHIQYVCIYIYISRSPDLQKTTNLAFGLQSLVKIAALSHISRVVCLSTPFQAKDVIYDDISASFKAFAWLNGTCTLKKKKNECHKKQILDNFPSLPVVFISK